MITIRPFEVVSSELITPRVKHIALKPTDGAAFPFLPGQFVTVHFEKDGHTLRRSYSIASIPGVDNTIDFAVSYVDNGPGSEYLFDLKAGDAVRLSGPFGRLILKEEPVKRLLLVATGTGVTPYRAMLPELTKRLAADADLQVCILQGIQHRKDVLYADDFLRWAKQYPERADFRAYLSREDLKVSQAAHEHSGYVHAIFSEQAMDSETDIVYLCGNPNMIDQAFAYLQEQGMPTSKIRREKYISSK